MRALELHFDPDTGDAAIHRTGCGHDVADRVSITPLPDTLEDAFDYPDVRVLVEQGWEVRKAPCLTYVREGRLV